MFIQPSSSVAKFPRFATGFEIVWVSLVFRYGLLMKADYVSRNWSSFIQTCVDVENFFANF